LQNIYFKGILGAAQGSMPRLLIIEVNNSTMAEIIHFLLQHWLLSGATVILLILLALNEWVAQRAAIYQLNTQEVVQMMNHHQAKVVDLRDQNHFEAAHIVGAIHIPGAQLDDKLNLINAFKKKPVILVCAQGTGASKAVLRLKSAGFEQVYCLAGGMLAWQKDNLPLLKNK
jgi:rhodanese-related sulfurtransferase